MSTNMKIFFFFHFLVHCEEEEIQDCHFQRLVKSPIYNTKEIIPLIATLTSSTVELEEHMLLQQYRRGSYILLQNQDITRAQ